MRPPNTERHVIVAGAGIGGLTAALTMARAGLRVTVLEQSTKFEAAGAGIQLSPNASRVLISLGLRDRLEPLVMVPQAVRIMAGGSARQIVRIPLGEATEKKYGAPYWIIHRGDLQTALGAAAQTALDVNVKLGVKFEDVAAHSNGVTVQGRSGRNVIDERGIALIGADGIWSSVKSCASANRVSVTAPLGARSSRPSKCRRNSARTSCICGSASMRIWCITR